MPRDLAQLGRDYGDYIFAVFERLCADDGKTIATARPPDLRRCPLITRASRSVARSLVWLGQRRSSPPAA
jgi:hypothetical protein